MTNAIDYKDTYYYYPPMDADVKDISALEIGRLCAVPMVVVPIKDYHLTPALKLLKLGKRVILQIHIQIKHCIAS